MKAFKNFRIRGGDRKVRRYIKDLCEQIVRVADPQKIILFGSYAYGKPTEDSDIDLLVVMPVKGHPAYKAAEIRMKIREKIETSMALDLLVRSPVFVAERIKLGDMFMREITEHGKVIYEAEFEVMEKQMNKTHSNCTRRQMIRSLFSGSILMPAVFSHLLTTEVRGEENPLAPKQPHFAPKAKRVIFIYLPGGCSHVDSFDYKPKLIADATAGLLYQGKRKLGRPLWEFKPRGKSGIYTSDLFPHIGEVIDDVCVINSMRNDHNDHFQATLGIHTGSVTFKRPSLGSWVSYGLGTENQNLPSFVALAPQLPYTGAQAWDSDFLPAVHQGTRVVAGEEPVPNLIRRAASSQMQESELTLLERFNRRHLQSRESDPQLEARIKSYETAFGMQQTMPEVLDLSKETDATLKLYGLERGQTTGFGWQALVARRMVEHGVRFIELIDVGASKNWDAHGDMKTHEPLARNIDKPIAGLIRDLKSRGLLEDTLVVWTTEFGRSPTAEGDYGRGHFSNVFSSWMAGGGVKGGMVYGKSDEYGMKVAENECHIHDFHATILHLLGFDHTRLTFRHGGRDYRLTDVHGNVVKAILA